MIIYSDTDMSHGDQTDEEPDSNLPDPSSQVTGPIYAEITDEEPNYATQCS